MGLNTWPMPSSNNDDNEKELAKHKETSGILSEQEKSILANKEILFSESRKSIVEKYLARISKRERDNFVFNDMEIDDERATEFIGKKITEEFIEQEPENYDESEVSWSITSTLDAVADKNPNNQPLGVDVVELAKQNNLPAVLITAKGHVKGERAVHIVDTFLRKNNFVDISNDQNNGLSQDIFFASKYDGDDFYDVVGRDKGSYEDFLERENNQLKDGKQKEWIENWQMTFNRIKEKIRNKDKYRILFVEDSPINFDIAKIALSKDIECSQIELVHAPDYESAQLLIEGNKANVDGVVTDLYFPEKLGSNDKTHGDQVYLKLAAQCIGIETAEMLLQKAKEMYGRE